MLSSCHCGDVNIIAGNPFCLILLALRVDGVLSPRKAQIADHLWHNSTKNGEESQVVAGNDENVPNMLF